jgi:hypothetical protein
MALSYATYILEGQKAYGRHYNNGQMQLIQQWCVKYGKDLRVGPRCGSRVEILAFDLVHFYSLETFIKKNS